MAFATEMKKSPFAQRLETEFAARRAQNSRYSLRAFSAFLGGDHSSLGQMLRGERPVPPGSIRKFGHRLGMSPEEIAAYVAAAHAPKDEDLAHQTHLRHWTAEALAVVSDPLHYRVFEIASSPGFRPDVRWIATVAESTPDCVNIAVQRLVRIGMLEMNGSNWRTIRCSGESQFRKTALDRVRQLAAVHNPNP